MKRGCWGRAWGLGNVLLAKTQVSTTNLMLQVTLSRGDWGPGWAGAGLLRALAKATCHREGFVASKTA